MKCILMHKNIPVIELMFSDVSGGMTGKGMVYNYEHLPLTTVITQGPGKGRADTAELNKWWVGRGIPASRDGLKRALNKLGTTVDLLLLKHYGLSLSDQYWICPEGSGLRWGDINFFENDFSEDIGEILFGRDVGDVSEVNFRSPDIASDGRLCKKWVIVGGRRVLMKGGYERYLQQPYNEVIATAIMRRLGIRHVGYTLDIVNGKPYSLCENFIDKDTELVTAYALTESTKRYNSESRFTHFVRCAEECGMSGVRELAEQMIVLDYIIANSDRHWSNFGFIRDANTLEWLGMAPIFDNGSSLWHDTATVGDYVKSASFTKSHLSDMKLVDNLSWYNYDLLDGLTDEIMEIFGKSDTVGTERARKIADNVELRCRAVADRCASIIPVAYGRGMDVVTAFIEDESGKRIGLRVLNRSNGAVRDIVPLPLSACYWNLTVAHGRMDCRLCTLSDFPVYRSNLQKVCNGKGGWVDGEYDDGRLRLISPGGIAKNVTQGTAIEYHSKFSLSNAEIVGGRLTGRNGRKFDRLA